MSPPSNSSDESSRTPFDETLNTSSSGDSVPAASTQKGGSHKKDHKSNFVHTKLKSWLLAMWDIPRANQLALAAVGGALAVVFLSGIVRLFIPHVDTTRLRNIHPSVTFVDKNAPETALHYRDGGITHNPSDGLSPETYRQGGAVQTEVMEPPGASRNSLITTGSSSYNLEPLTEEDRKRVEMRQREDQIIIEKRLLEDKKRAIERQIEDKQIEEQRNAEDKKRLEDRDAQDKQVIDQRQQEEKRKLEEEQRKLDEEHRKIAEAG